MGNLVQKGRDYRRQVSRVSRSVPWEDVGQLLKSVVSQLAAQAPLRERGRDLSLFRIRRRPAVPLDFEKTTNVPGKVVFAKVFAANSRSSLFIRLPKRADSLLI
jgi:hypothetical protein